MQRKKGFRLITAGCALSLMMGMLSGCAPKAEPSASPSAQTPQQSSQPQQTTTYEQAVKGYGGDVSATLVLNGTVIEALSVQGADETPDIGGTAIEQYNQQFEALKGSEIGALNADALDAVAGATVTSNAVKGAVKGVAAQAAGEGASDKKPVADSKQTYEVNAHSLTQKMQVEVELKDNAIASVKVLENGETESILKTVTDLMIPRVLESQSLAVDAITGATVSSNAVKSAVAQAIDANGGDSSQWYTEIPKKTDVVKLEGYDTIVVGLGGAGMAAYVSAAENGAAVFGLDAAGKIGGTSTNISGPMAINPKSKMDAENEGKKWLEEEDLIQDWLAYTQGDAKEELVRQFVNESGETMDWMIEKHGFTFGPMMSFFHPKGWVVWASYQGDKTQAYVSAVEGAKALNEKNDYMLELTAQELITDNGKITGVKAVLYDGTVYEIYGDSVILATGGFIGNSAMKKQYLGGDYMVEGMMQDNGAGINMALSVGAATYNIDMPPMIHVAQTKTLIRTDEVTPEQKAVLTGLVLKPDAMIVGENGARFMNESGNIAFDNWKGGAQYYSVYSQQQIDSYKEKGMEIVANPMFLSQGATLEANTPIADMDEILQAGEKYGIVVKADTVQELAEKLNAPELENAVAQYNTYADGSAQDPFGKDKALINSLEQGPYYAVIGAGYAYGTCGGLDVDTNMNVLDINGKPIENLYAAGQDSMGVLFTNKDAYVTYGGAAHGWVLTSGRLAGQHAAGTFAEK